MMLFGTGMTAFATLDTSSAADVSTTAAESSEDTTPVANSEAAAAEGVSTTAADTTTRAGEINASPNTGVPIAPMAVALLAICAVPVILATKKK